MKQLWRSILNVFHPKITNPLEDWQKEVFEELDKTSPLSEDYWELIELLSSKGDAEMYFLKKKRRNQVHKPPERQRQIPEPPIISSNYTKSLHGNPYYRKDRLW